MPSKPPKSFEVQLDEEAFDNAYEPPRIETPGWILFHAFNISEDPLVKEWEYDVVDWDDESGVFWIHEGMGFDCWLEDHIQDQLKEDGYYRVGGVKGLFTEDYYGEVDEEWEYDTFEKTSNTTISQKEDE